MNLSKSEVDIIKSYNKLLATYENTPVWFNRYSQWVNIVLGTPNNNVIDINGVKIKLTEENFQNYEPTILEMITAITKVKIGGELITVDKSSV